MSNLASTSNTEKTMQPSIDDWVKENLRYDPDKGYLWWTKRVGGRPLDRPAGNLNTIGYIVISCRHEGVDKRFYAHRLAWFLHHGVWPKDQIDHINNLRDDNRLVNLREATGAENNKNLKAREGGTSKYKGVSWFKRDCKWLARIGVNKENIFLGYYDNEQEAALAYNKAALEYFGEYAKINIIEPLDTGMTNNYISSSSGELTY